MTFWQIESKDPTLLESISADFEVAKAFGISFSQAAQHLEHLRLGWRTVVRADRCALNTLDRLGLVIARADVPLAPVAAAPAASQRFARVWNRFRAELEALAPEALAALNPPALEEHRRAVETIFGAELPEDYVAWLALHDGCHESSGPFEWELNDLASVIRSKKVLDGLLLDDEIFADADEGIEPPWWHRQWVPFASNGSGDHLFIDLKSTVEGERGRVMKYLRDSSRRTVVAPSFLDWVSRNAVDFFEGRFVATEDQTGFFGMLQRTSLVGSLSSLLVRGESEEAHNARIERELLGNPIELAKQVLPRLRNRSLLEYEGVLSLRGLELMNELVAALNGKKPGERALAIHRVLEAHSAVTSYLATVDDVERAIAESRQ